MTKTEMLDKIEALETEIANLRAELEKPDMPWVPEIGDTYFKTSGSGEIVGHRWDNDRLDNACLSIGNVFRTREDAEFMVERLKVLAELRRLAKGFVPDFGNKRQKKWFLGDWPNVTPDFNVGANYGVIYFQSREDALAAIEAVGVERLKKYYFMVGENV